MRVVAIRSFAGNVSMYKGEERDIESEKTLSDLLEAGYVKTITDNKETTVMSDQEEPEAAEDTATLKKKSSLKKAGVKNESK